MPEIQLPDGSKRTFDGPVSVMEVATDIGPGLARATLAGEVDGELVDASHLMHADAKLRLITERDPEALDLIRHSTAHLMAQAVQRLFPKAQVTIGPVIEHGFFYDFSYPPGFTEEDLVAIEKEMKNVVNQGFAVERSVMSREKAVKFFKDKGEDFKVEVIESIPGDEDLGFYQQGEFIDLCRGPHVPDTGKLKAFKLMSVAGAYWRGDSSKPMLQRIYGTAWANKKDLKAHLHRLEEAKKRDHRRLGKQLDLFHTQPEAPGMIFWHDRGWKIYIAIQTYLRAKLRRHGYQEINTPQLVDRVLWEKSGHWDKFGDMMFSTSSENRDYAIKPMNCPCHVQVFNQGLKSYRDLPLRMAEFGSCHRNEPSGTLHGLMRVRNFVQDDAHIFCTEAQIQPEVSSFIDLVYEVYEDFGFENIIVKLSTRPEQRVGSDADWDRSEKALATALDDKKLDWDLQPGEGAFYGPKIEFSLKDSLERVWQCGTMQVDFSTPGKLDASYVDEDSKRQTPVMLHRAILGSLERFIGVLIEHYAGAFPVWLAPVQLVFISIADRHHDYCREMADLAQNSGLRVDLDLRNEKIGFKIREQTIQRVPYMLIIGDNEVDERQVAVRSRSGENLGSMSMDNFIHRLQSESAVQ